MTHNNEEHCSCNPAFDKGGFCSECGATWGWQNGQEPIRREPMDIFEYNLKHYQNGTENEEEQELFVVFELPEHGSMKARVGSLEAAEEAIKLWNGRAAILKEGKRKTYEVVKKNYGRDEVR